MENMLLYYDDSGKDPSVHYSSNAVCMKLIWTMSWTQKSFDSSLFYLLVLPIDYSYKFSMYFISSHRFNLEDKDTHYFHGVIDVFKLMSRPPQVWMKFRKLDEESRSIHPSLTFLKIMKLTPLKSMK